MVICGEACEERDVFDDGEFDVLFADDCEETRLLSLFDEFIGGTSTILGLRLWTVFVALLDSRCRVCM